MNRRLAGIALVVGLAAVLALSVVLLVVKNKDKDIAPGADDRNPQIAQQTDDTVTEPSTEDVVSEPDVGEYHASEDDKIDPATDERRMIANVNPEFKDGKDAAVFAYNNTEDVAQLVEIHTQSDSTLLFRDVVEAGKSIDTIELLEDLDKGEYFCYVTIMPYDTVKKEPKADTVPMTFYINIKVLS